MNFKVLALLFLLAMVGLVSADSVIIPANFSANLVRNTDGCWTALRDGAGEAITFVGNFESGNTFSLTTTNNYSWHMRGAINIPINATWRTTLKNSTITNVTFTGTGYTKAGGLGQRNAGLIYASPATKGIFVATDYNATNFSRLANDITYTNFAITNNTNIWSFNALGISVVRSAVNGDGAVPIIADHSSSIDNSSLTWASGAQTQFSTRNESIFSGIYVPYLNITYSPFAAPIGAYSQDLVRQFVNGAVFFSDTSTGTPASSWYWDFGDGSTGTTQNLSHTYTSVGTFSVKLRLTNDWGETWVNKTDNIAIVTGTPPPPMGILANNNTYQNITTYDGYYMLNNPTVIYTGSGWNGFKYLMAMTPYYQSNNAYENPSMRYSNNGYNWTTIPGQADPIVAYPGAPGYNSDPYIVLNGSTLYLFYRTTATASEADSYWNRTTTTDGITWTAPVTMNFGTLRIRSASFLFNGTGWEGWAHNITSNNLTHYTTPDLVTWTQTGNTSINTSTTQWHSEVKMYGNQYQLLVCDGTTGGSLTKNLRFYNSSDGLNWTSSNNNAAVLTNRTDAYWDEKMYKSSFVYRGGGWQVWYSGWNTSNWWKVAYAQSGTITGETPVSAFSATPRSGNAPLLVQFTDSSTNTPTSWLWNFGDGYINNLQNPYHTYQTTGSCIDRYTVSLTATNDDGSNTTTKSDYIVTDSCPAKTATEGEGRATCPTSVLASSMVLMGTTMIVLGAGAVLSSRSNPSAAGLGMLIAVIGIITVVVGVTVAMAIMTVIGCA
jgi:PKD repeat protein